MKGPYSPRSKPASPRASMPSKVSPAAAAESAFIRMCVQSSSVALIWYDYYLTFPREVRYIWSQRVKLSTVFYFLCRYSMIVNVLYLFKLLNMLGTPAVQDKLFIAVDLASVLARASVIAIFTLRTYVVWGRHWLILATLGLLGCICVVVDLLDMRGITYSNPEIPLLVAKVLSYLMVAFETLASTLTIWRAVQAIRETKHSQSLEDNLIFLILKQGILYFLVVVCLTTAAVVVNYIKEGFWQRLLSAFVLPVSAILAARFLLHLRHWEAKQHKQSATANLPGSGIEFGGTTTLASNGLHTSVFTLNDFGDDPVAERRRETSQWED
ncbi:hypothetical protein CYLTODRAFT_396536 [Cylindrobasidium torrendii FP15055 ss-10]|uniref:DUF6533 domain-containing protein n=1 Tax=Cylindrobasidium torrendii FP15055 ss-10 TaxID=1314674 RepID=A0A0D7BB47_9AGAR|nr:hypothetical protein CYLTODRAFT_396536 [Cylindrobasidium torrendii FP15055 ss-10]